jgi:transketolase
LTKENLGIPVSPSFFVPSEMLAFQKKQVEKGKKLEMEWREKSQWTETKVNFSEITFPEFAAGSSVATRNASGKVLDTIFSKIPGLIGGSADLTPSNKTFPKGETAFSPQNRQGRYIHYGIREHGMGAIMNGMALHGGIIPYGGTFFVFTDYMRASMRLAALMKIRVIYVMTHDSIGLGEDGPTHQPIEHLSSLRPMPNMVILRPMDAPETSESWKIALQRENGPTCLVLTRQNLPVYDRPALGMNPAELTSKGGYVLTEDQGFDRIIMASGSEVEIAVEAKKILNKNEFKVRVVSMPSCELFDQQSPEYKESVLPNSVRKRLAVEAGSTLSWHKYTGLDGKVVGLDHFGASAPFEKLYQEFGLTPENVAEKVKGL